MAAGRRGDGAGEVAVEVGVVGARNVPGAVGLFAGARVGEIKATVDDDPRRAAKMLGKLAGGNESRIGHGWLRQ
jgi:hypothetical protein